MTTLTRRGASDNLYEVINHKVGPLVKPLVTGGLALSILGGSVFGLYYGIKNRGGYVFQGDIDSKRVSYEENRMANPFSEAENKNIMKITIGDTTYIMKDLINEPNLLKSPLEYIKTAEPEIVEIKRGSRQTKIMSKWLKLKCSGQELICEAKKELANTLYPQARDLYRNMLLSMRDVIKQRLVEAP